MTASNSLLAKKRCVVRDANFENAPLSGPLLREKALQLTPHQLLIWLILMIFSTV